MQLRSCRRRFYSSAFTLMEIMVVMAIIVVLASIAYPVYVKIKTASNKAVALNVMRQLASAMATYAAQNNGLLPCEDTAGRDTWESTKLPEADKAWYNALPRLLNMKGVGDFAREGRPADFYTKENLLFLPGAEYQARRRLTRSYFAIAMNTKLFRKGADGRKPELRLSQIQFPSRTVLFPGAGSDRRAQGARFDFQRRLRRRAQGQRQVFRRPLRQTRRDPFCRWQHRGGFRQETAHQHRRDRMVGPNLGHRLVHSLDCGSQRGPECGSAAIALARSSLPSPTPDR